MDMDIKIFRMNRLGLPQEGIAKRVGQAREVIRDQSLPNNKVPGWHEDQVTEFQEQAESAFSIWEKEADAQGGFLLVSGKYIPCPLR